MAITRGDHAIHVAHDAADAGGRALIGQHLRGVIVALVGNDDAVALALMLGEEDDAGVSSAAGRRAGSAPRWAGFP